jgi:hypothetical protein
MFLSSLSPVRRTGELNIETLNTARISKREENIMKHLNRFYKSLLLLSLAMTPSAAFALEPLIEGAKIQNDVPINAFANWNVLLGPVQVQIPQNSVYHCEVTCTSTVKNPHNPNADQDYYYAAFNSAAANNPAPADACVRPFDFDQEPGGIDKLDKLVVADTCFIPNLAGNQFFYCLGRKEDANQVNTFVDNTSMHVICVDRRGSGAPEQ